MFFFFFNDTATTEIYTLSLHDALPILVEIAESVDFLEVGTEAEALLAEQNFIKQYQPRFNIRLRDDKSYPFIAISMDEEFPRVYFTRERHRRDQIGRAHV